MPHSLTCLHQVGVHVLECELSLLCELEYFGSFGSFDQRNSDHKHREERYENQRAIDIIFVNEAMR